VVSGSIAYLTDVEGQWQKLAAFCADNPCVRLDAAGALHVSDGCVFVFGGDAIDRGDASRRIVRALLDVKLRQPDRVVLLVGNRDLNKIRLVRELRGAPPVKAPAEVRGASPGTLLPWIFTHTMGAKAAFEFRRAELRAESRPDDDESVAESYLVDLAPDGDLTRYLAACQLAYLRDGALFVHGAVTDENLGVVPGREERLPTVARWVDGLNDFYAHDLAAWRRSLDAPLVLEGDGWAGRVLVEYQAPVPDTKLNQRSVIYGRPTDALNTPWLPSRAVVERLRGEGVRALLVGHTPSGDTPAVLRDEGFTFVMADNSYGRVETGSRVTLRDGAMTVQGETQLDDGARVEVGFAVDDDPLLGRRDDSTGEVVKARLATGDYLLFKALPENRVSQCAISPSALRSRALSAPYRPDDAG
jgi:Calcineurin-like phosphoesterase